MWNIYLKLNGVLRELQEVKSELRDLNTNVRRALRYMKEESPMASQALLDQIKQLQAEVTANTDATSAATKVINSFADKINAAVATATDDTAAVAAIKDVVSAFQANDAALAQAVAANTPADPAAPPAPAPATP